MTTTETLKQMLSQGWWDPQNSIWCLLITDTATMSPPPEAPQTHIPHTQHITDTIYDCGGYHASFFSPMKSTYLQAIKMDTCNCVWDSLMRVPNGISQAWNQQQYRDTKTMPLGHYIHKTKTKQARISPMPSNLHDCICTWPNIHRLNGCFPIPSSMGHKYIVNC